jgi:release factor glutamine methyltransferase
MENPTKIASLRKAMLIMMSNAGIVTPELEADRIICHALGLSRASLLAHPERDAARVDVSHILRLGNRRASGEPLAYVLGDALFLGRSFLVDKRVLIPRPETEMLTGFADEFLKLHPESLFADWCTGSGCVAIALLAENPRCAAYAVDSSADALAVALINAKRYSVDGRVTFVLCADLSSPVIESESLDLVVANPPYIPSGIIKTLETQVRDHEPTEALDGGADGLNVFRLLLRGLPRLMKRGAPLFLETGGGSQIEEIRVLAENIAPEFSLEKILYDHRSIARYMIWRKAA